jgi:NAD(P)-dependent dehydrogenase (short-subunit alcohol dehydrogenase family)
VRRTGGVPTIFAQLGSIAPAIQTLMADAKKKCVAIVAGVGPGLGAALVRKLVSENCSVGMFARSAEFIGKLATEIRTNALAIPTDVSDAKQVADGFRKVREQLGPVEVLIANASGSVGQGLMETTPDEFEQSWRIGVCGAFLCAREAVLDMLQLATASPSRGGRGYWRALQSAILPPRFCLVSGLF